MPDEYGIQSIPPHYDEFNSYYVHTSEGYSKAVEEIEAEEREIAEAEIRTESQRVAEENERRRLEEFNREREQQILQEIRMKEEERSVQTAEISEYEDRQEEFPPGTNVDLLA